MHRQEDATRPSRGSCLLDCGVDALPTHVRACVQGRGRRGPRTATAAQQDDIPTA